MKNALIIGTILLIATPAFAQGFDDPYGSLAASSSWTQQQNMQDEVRASQDRQQEQMREQREENERQQQQIQQQQDQFNNMSPAERLTYGHL